MKRPFFKNKLLTSKKGVNIETVMLITLAVILITIVIYKILEMKSNAVLYP